MSHREAWVRQDSSGPITRNQLAFSKSDPFKLGPQQQNFHHKRQSLNAYINPMVVKKPLNLRPRANDTSFRMMMEKGNRAKAFSEYKP